MNLVKPIRPMVYSFKERQSKFFSNLRSMDRVSDFKTWIGELRKEYHDATHICWAYRIDDTNEIQENFSDAGEPSGTAGLPILNAMKQKNVVGCGISVIRYFGGTKLGKRELSFEINSVSNGMSVTTAATRNRHPGRDLGWPFHLMRSWTVNPTSIPPTIGTGIKYANRHSESHDPICKNHKTNIGFNNVINGENIATLM